jgi:DNA-binding MarR family transcriptional regulator
MSTAKELCEGISVEVRDTCLCLHLQRAARAVSRRFDDAFRPLALGNGQFSLLMALNRADPPTIGQVATLLAMDRTTLTAALKPLARRGLVEVVIDAADRRTRRLAVTEAGHDLLIKALPIWRQEHALLDRAIGLEEIDRLRSELRTLS